jgi:hypothetical protein
MGSVQVIMPFGHSMKLRYVVHNGPVTGYAEHCNEQSKHIEVVEFHE